MSIILTGASGAFGRKATETLMKRVSPSDLILVTRNPDSLTDAKAKGATIRYGDFDDEESLKTAFVGGTKMLMISTMNVGRRAEQHLRAINAAKASGVEHIVYTSSDGLDKANPALIGPDHLKTENNLKASGLKYTIMRDSLYAETVVQMIAPQGLKNGFWRSPARDGVVGFSAKKDCAECAATVVSSDGHENKTYAITGPVRMTFKQGLEIVSDVMKAPIEWIDISFQEFDEDLQKLGIPWDYEQNMNIEGMTSGRHDIITYEQGVRLGYFSNLSNDVQHILGRPPTSFREVAEDNFEFLKQFIKNNR